VDLDLGEPPDRRRVVPVIEDEADVARRSADGDLLPGARLGVAHPADRHPALPVS
jgi:hypothetical protein